MAESVEAGDGVRRQRGSLLWCLLGGAGLGAFWGGVIGAVLGAFALTLAYPRDPTSETLLFGAIYGVIPGVSGGFWIGMTSAVRDGRWAMAVGTTLGVALGTFTSWLVVERNLANTVYMMVHLVPWTAFGAMLLVWVVRSMSAGWSWRSAG